MSFGGGEKGRGLGLGDVEQLMRPLSFGFQTPQRPGIRRKPLNWDAARIGGDGISAIGMALRLSGHAGHAGRDGHGRSMSAISEGSGNARYEERLDSEPES